MKHVWLGITDSKEEGKWVYSSDGKEISVTDWKSDSSAETEGTNTNEKDCATMCDVMSLTKGRWCAVECSSTQQYICEEGKQILMKIFQLLFK